MTRHLLALVAATALGASAVPAAAQDRPPPPAPTWGDPQAPHYPGPPPMPDRADRAGAPFAHPFPPGGYQAGPYPGGPGPYPGMPMSWQSGPVETEGGGYSYSYGYQSAPCGCPSYTWVPVPVETHYRYSAPVRHVEEVTEERVVREQVVEHKTVRLRPTTKYVKAAPPAKLTKGKVVRSAK
jgi:hypothetical protein